MSRTKGSTVSIFVLIWLPNPLCGFNSIRGYLGKRVELREVPGCGVPFSHVSDSRCEEDTAARIEDDLAQLNTTVLDLHGDTSFDLVEPLLLEVMEH